MRRSGMVRIRDESLEGVEVEESDRTGAVLFALSSLSSLSSYSLESIVHIHIITQQYYAIYEISIHICD